MTIPPDTKDWTWVLDRACPECGHQVGLLTVAELAPLLRATADAWAGVLASSGDLAARSSPTTWSPLEYACHVRDVFVVFGRRVGLMLAADDPRFENWDQDAAAVESAYGTEDPAAVSAELVAAAGALADRFDGIDAAGWERPGRRSDGASFTVASLARYMLHDTLHHLWDVGAPFPDIGR